MIIEFLPFQSKTVEMDVISIHTKDKLILIDGHRNKFQKYAGAGICVQKKFGTADTISKRTKKD